MKKGIYGILTALTVFALVMTGCPTGSSTISGGKSSEAELLELEIDSREVYDFGYEITPADWDEAVDMGDLSSSSVGNFEIEEASKSVLIKATASDYAKVELAITDDQTKPTTFSKLTDAGATKTIKARGYVVLKITSEDGKTINYYAVKIDAGTNTDLDGLRIADLDVVEPVSGTLSETLSGLQDNEDGFNKVYLPDAKKTNAEVTLNYPSEVFKGKAYIARVSKSATVSEGDFTLYNPSNKPKFTFADEDKLYVKMLAQNEEDVMYYAFKVLIGWDASLREITLVDSYTNQPVGNVDIILGEPKDAINKFTPEDEGKIQFNAKGDKFKVTAVPGDAAANKSISKDGSDFTTIPNGGEVTFAEGDYLYVKIISSNTNVTNYYKLKIVLLRSVAIPYGTPAAINADLNAAAQTWWDDPANATGWLDINRINKTEGKEILDIDPKDRTFGRAKLAWDEDGMYIYAQVWEQNITQMEESGSSNHTVSSVELFICESGSRTGTVAASVNQNGGQYRLGVNNVRSGPQTDQLAAFNGLNKSSAKKWTANDFPYPAENDTNVRNGYVVMFQAPWLFPDRYDFGTDHKKLTIELQINAIGAGDAGRVGVLNWNNENSNSYNEVANFGDATLELNGHTLGSLGARITTQPKNQSIKIGSGAAVNELSVDAESPDNGNLTFEWFKVTSAVATGGTSVGTGKTYTPTGINLSVEGKYYYYAKITNTKTGAAPSIRTSNVVTITVYTPVAATGDVELLPPEKTVTLTANYMEVLNLQYDVDLANYSRLEIWYSIDGGTAVEGPMGSDFFIEVTGSDGTKIAVPDSAGGYQGTNYNADGLLLDDGGEFAGTSYNLAAYAAATGGGSAKIVVKFKPGVNGGVENGPSLNLGKDATITSAKLIGTSGNIELLPPKEIVKTLTANYMEVLNLQYDVDLASYSRLEIWYSIDGGTAVEGPMGSDFFIEVTGSDGTKIAVPDSAGGYQGTNYNADGLLLDDGGEFAGTSYNLAAYAAATGGGSAKIVVKFKPGVNGGVENGPSLNLGKDATITSAKLIFKTTP